GRLEVAWMVVRRASWGGRADATGETMGQIISLWYQRNDARSVTLYSAPMDASAIRDATLMVNILSLGTGTVTLALEHSVDPNNPNSWSSVASVVASATGNTSGVAGGYSSGTTVAVGPYVRFTATLVISSGSVTWSASAVTRA